MVFTILVPSLLVFIVPLFVNGPVAARVYSRVVENRNVWSVLIFWGILISLNFLGALLIIMTAGHAVAGPGVCACLALPISSIITVRNMLESRKAMLQRVEDNVQQQRLYSLGIVLIPALQYIVIIVTQVFIAPPLCGWLFSIGFSCL